MKELNESINEAKRRINGRDRWRSDYEYEDDLEHDYGYESSYHNLYDTHQVNDPSNPLQQCNTSFVMTTPNNL